MSPPASREPQERSPFPPRVVEKAVWWRRPCGGEGRVARLLRLASRFLRHEAALDELLQHPREALLGNTENIEEFGHRNARVPPDEMEHAVVRPPDVCTKSTEPCSKKGAASPAHARERRQPC